MSDLSDFNDGFSDGWHARQRQSARGSTYLHAYKSGREAASREKSDTPK